MSMTVNTLDDLKDPITDLPIKIHLDSDKQSCIRWRFVTAAMSFFTIFNSYSLRNNISVTIVSMVNSTTSGTSVTECGNYTESEGKNGEFNWDSQTQGIILGALYWGYIVPQIFAGGLADKYGAKRVLLVGGFMATVSTLLAPIAARTNLGFFIATRVVCGLGLAFYAPCTHGILGHWYNSAERSRATAFVYSGSLFGTAFSMAVSGVLCERASDGGWPWPFYLSGILSFIWLVLWSVLVFSTPRQNPWITTNEVGFIESDISEMENKTFSTVPWRSMLTSSAVYAVVINNFGSNWGFYTLMSQLPSFMNDVLGFDMLSNGLYSSLPYILNGIYAILAGILADYLIKNNILSTKNVRRLCGVSAMYGSGVCLLIITFLKCQTMAIYALLVLAICSLGSNLAGGMTNNIDLAPNFAATLQGFAETFGTIPGIVSPYITGVIIENNQTQERWNIVFYITFAILIVFGLFFGILCQGEVQSWNKGSTKDSGQSDSNGHDMTIGPFSGSTRTTSEEHLD